jgi:hypothetical protein
MMIGWLKIVLESLIKIENQKIKNKLWLKSQ